ncbi:hypothetical protein MUK42_35535 [Musa troglodytarum]|uniref:Uncharacterized protein n=1 Tax=Musa troglodytarum TaxID=320322 RepID=A0A9E7HW10_9LILI|nr:hypothetical protein MUK42_35535 [Musa troglodytarum]
MVNLFDSNDTQSFPDLMDHGAHLKAPNNLDIILAFIHLFNFGNKNVRQSIIGHFVSDPILLRYQDNDERHDVPKRNITK